jgi:hypothetical protein
MGLMLVRSELRQAVRGDALRVDVFAGRVQEACSGSGECWYAVRGKGEQTLVQATLGLSHGTYGLGSLSHR